MFHTDDDDDDYVFVLFVMHYGECDNFVSLECRQSLNKKRTKNAWALSCQVKSHSVYTSIVNF